MPPSFIMLAHDARGRCWYYCSRGWAFPPVLHYILLLCDRWQQRNSLTNWHLTWKWVWSKSMSLKSSMWEKWHLLTFPDTCWTFKETKQWMWAQRGSGWCISAVVTAMWKTNHVLDSYAQLSPWNEEHLHQLICMNQQIATGELCTELNVSFNALEMMVETLE